MNTNHHIDPAVTTSQAETTKAADERTAFKLYLCIDGENGEMRMIETDADAAYDFWNDANLHAASVAGMSDGDIAYYVAREVIR